MGLILKSAPQQFSITISGTSTSGTQTITAVTAANSIIVYQGVEVSDFPGANVNNIGNTAVLTNGTTVTATRTNDLASVTTIIKGVVLEFTPGSFKSIQKGTISLSGVDNNTASISSVNTSKAFCLFNGGRGGDSGASDALAGVALTNPTTVTATIGSAGSGIHPTVVAYNVLELN